MADASVSTLAPFPLQTQTCPLPLTRRSNPADIRVVGVGLGRTGTMSLCSALQKLSFGPCYHPMKVPPAKNDWEAWARIAEAAYGDVKPEDFDAILQGYHSVVDTPVAMMTSEVLRAFPNAKFILTTRDPNAWAQSLKSTVLAAYELFSDRTDIPPHLKAAVRWTNAYFANYHRGRLATHPQEEFTRHAERIKALIPAERLLEFDVRQGWKPLCDFLGVPIPDEPFPHLNDSGWYQEKVLLPNMPSNGSAT